MEYEQWLGILTSINADNDLNESNIIKKIGEKLEKEDPDTYQEWQDNQCGVNYTLLDSQLTLLHIAAANGPTKVREFLIKKVLMLIKQIVDGLLYIRLLAIAIKE